MDKILICDFDGTLVKSSTELEFVKFLTKKRKLNLYHYLLSIFSVPLNTMMTLLNHGSLLKSWTVGRTKEEEKTLIEQFYLYIAENYLVNNNVLKIVNNFKGKKILLTGCYRPLAKYMLKELKIDFIFDEIYGSEMGCWNYIIKSHPYGHDKLKFLPNNAELFGIGNAWSDRFFLKKCNNVYIVSGSKKLEKLAFSKKWEIISN